MRNYRIITIVLLVSVCLLVFAAPAFAGAVRAGGYWPYTGTSSNMGYISGRTADYGTGTPGATSYYLVRDSPPYAGTHSLAGSTDTYPNSPHGGYTTSSGKCKTCHAVHGAGINVDNTTAVPITEKLLRSTAAGACTYCHMTTNFATTVYGGDPNNYVEAAEFGNSGHASDHENGRFQGCPNCHAVHGAGTIVGSPILKNDPAAGVTTKTEITLAAYGSGYNGKTTYGYGAYEAPVANMTQFCEDCHNGTKRVKADGNVVDLVSSTQFADVFANCLGCHAGGSIATDYTKGNGTAGSGNMFTALNNSRRVQFGVNAASTRDGRSHVMTTNPNNAKDAKVAWASSGDLTKDSPSSTACASCHDATDFPHFQNAGQGFQLIAGWTTNPDGTTNTADASQGNVVAAAADQACLKCHRDPLNNGTTVNNGVGLTY